MLTVEDVKLIFEIIRKQYGSGYAEDEAVARLQAKLSIMLEAKVRTGVAKVVAEERKRLAELDRRQDGE